MWDSKVVLLIFVVIPSIMQAPADYSLKPIVWVYGGPGSGKSTVTTLCCGYAHKITYNYGFTRLSVGELLREEIKSGSTWAKSLASVMQRGELVSAEFVLELLKKAMDANVANSNGFVIDGFPRDVTQGETFEESIARPTVILYFEASADTLKKRLLDRAAISDRADDNEETIGLRLKTFQKNNDKILAKYPNMIRINAERSVEEVLADVRKAFDAISTRQ